MSDPTSQKKGGLWARLFAMASEDVKTKQEPPVVESAGPGIARPGDAQPAADAAPLAAPVETPLALPLSGLAAIPLSQTVAAALAEAPPAEAEPEAPPEFPVDLELEAAAPSAHVGVELGQPPPPEVVPRHCAACGAVRKSGQVFCDDCGYLFPKDEAPASGSPAGAAAVASPSSPRGPLMAKTRIKDRYEIGDLLSENAGISRYRGYDHAGGKPVPVTILWAGPKDSGGSPLSEAPAVIEEEEILPGFDNVVPVATTVAEGDWPSIAWEKNLLERAKHPALPSVLDHFHENNAEFLVEEMPEGRSLWDAWDDPDADAAARYGWLMQIAEGMDALSKAGALIEGIRPDFITVVPAEENGPAGGQARIADLSELLPLPLPPNPPIKATLYTAPELVLDPEKADARAGLYSFGAMLYSLEYLHHSLEENDFESSYVAKQITDRFPDVHPLFFRLINKTFVRDVHTRFPTDEAGKVDLSGFTELVRSLDVCRRNFDNVRLDIAAWTTTGMVRTGNEDAFALLHGVEARMDDLWEYALVLLCDGMGGYEAGEVAAAMALHETRQYLLSQPLFAALTGQEPPSAPADPTAYQEVLLAALRHANKEIYTAARTPGGKGRRGMGCTAECLYVDNRQVIVGHVGDSRTYHLSQGRLKQLTRDQTFVSRMVELRQLTAEEAENHPRKNELQQALGGQPEVVPGVYSARLRRGDWVLVCSDGLTNHIPTADLEKMLTREAAYSAEEAARRLLNLVNLRGATDNATIVVIRAS
jgi:protein phosphatase